MTPPKMVPWWLVSRGIISTRIAGLSCGAFRRSPGRLVETPASQVRPGLSTVRKPGDGRIPDSAYHVRFPFRGPGTGAALPGACHLQQPVHGSLFTRTGWRIHV
jgi:hypothetical protein